MQNVTLKVDGMSCAHCVNSVEGAVKQLGAKATVDLAGHAVTVRYDEAKTTLAAIKEAIEDQGYDVR
ncbi:copper ion binding protein [Cohnella nanjingensis]|uniref:Heavy-metal-associated domain-containing protein n=1 Tax=Cohnella nanjingensis TaxID=1387779 RepID=A0A7X0VGE5_9BACL|nr:copper ion binding protein [Cohnella nanjingensis]MBB6672776.1 heavy-metal-associated domain-containing protein [Cohnella nanjingensis]